ncbi:hypothetical protein PMAYCL1PPCAC_07765, partial [Pristionchus mayeri]
ISMKQTTDTPLLVEANEEEEQPSCFARFLKLAYKADEEDDEDLSSVEPVSFLELFRFASSSEILAIGAGVILSVLIGLCSPAYIYLSGTLTTLYVDVEKPEGDLEFLHHIWRLSSLYGVLFVVTFALGYTE